MFISGLQHAARSYVPPWQVHSCEERGSASGFAFMISAKGLFDAADTQDLACQGDLRRHRGSKVLGSPLEGTAHASPVMAMSRLTGRSRAMLSLCAGSPGLSDSATVGRAGDSLKPGGRADVIVTPADGPSSPSHKFQDLQPRKSDSAPLGSFGVAPSGIFMCMCALEQAEPQGLKGNVYTNAPEQAAKARDLGTRSLVQAHAGRSARR